MDSVNPDCCCKMCSILLKLFSNYPVTNSRSSVTFDTNKHFDSMKSALEFYHVLLSCSFCKCQYSSVLVYCKLSVLQLFLSSCILVGTFWEISYEGKVGKKKCVNISLFFLCSLKTKNFLHGIYDNFLIFIYLLFFTMHLYTLAISCTLPCTTLFPGTHWKNLCVQVDNYWTR